MKSRNVFSQAVFNDLLEWLSADREVAGGKYVEIREGLVRYFRMKGCYEPEGLADETINRLAEKLKTLDVSGDLRPISYFYGFAKNIFLEYLTDLKKTPIQLELPMVSTLRHNEYDETKERRFLCLDECMANLKDGESEMVLGYFAKNRSEKFETRRHLAERLNISMGNLHIRVHRVKNSLRNCVENCLKDK